MSRYIDANAYAAEMKTRQDALKELIDDAVALDNWEMYDGLSREFSVFIEAKMTLGAMPTVDAVPVVHGEWIFNGRFAELNHYACSNCNRTEFRMSDYCPNCGARMKTVTDCHTLEGER